MMKAAVFAGALVLGFASAAQAVDVTFSEVGIAPTHDQDVAASFDGGNWTLNFFSAGGNGRPQLWDNAVSFWYGSGAHAASDVAYLPGEGSDATANRWQVTIVADAGFEIAFDSYSLLRRAGMGNVNVSVDGTTNDSLTQATVFDGNNTYTRTYGAGTKPTGTSVILSYIDSQDVAMDGFSFTVQAIPEPTVLAPMALAGMGMFLRRRRA
jgi:hypothetical protein